MILLDQTSFGIPLKKKKRTLVKQRKNIASAFDEWRHAKALKGFEVDTGMGHFLKTRYAQICQILCSGGIISIRRQRTGHVQILLCSYFMPFQLTMTD